MKAPILAAVMTLVVFVVATLALRRLRSESRARLLTFVYLACVPVLLVTWIFTPDDLGFIPSGLLTAPSWLDCVAAFFFFSAAFFGGVLQLYNLADRGFSLRILIDLLEDPGRRGDVDWLMTGYSRGQGISWMYGKRMDDMLSGGFLERVGDQILLTPKGMRVAAVAYKIRSFLKLDSAN